MRGALLLLLLPAAATAREAKPWEALPTLGTVTARGGTRLVLRGEVSPMRRAEVLARAQVVADDVAARLAMAPVAEKRTVQACVFETTAAYRRFAEAVTAAPPSELGFYLPAERVVVVNLRYGLRNLSHELVHALVGDDFPAVPAWLTEGLGALYGGSSPQGARLRFFVNYRIRDVKAALAEGRLPEVARLATASSDEVYGDQAMVWYGLARAVLLFLEDQGELGAFYAAVRGGAEAGAELRRRVPEAAFRRFVLTAKEGAGVGR